MGLLKQLLDGLRGIVAKFPDSREGTGWRKYSMEDVGMAAFSLFFMQSESFLAYQRRLESGHHSSNCQTLFGMSSIPSDNHIRTLLDEVPANQLQPAFDQVFESLDHYKGVRHFQVLGDRTLIALDGTEYFCSQKRGCPCCQTRRRSNGVEERYHSMLGVSMVTPQDNRVLSLFPEFITPQDGHDKQDCEREAVKRWLKTHHHRVAKLKPIYLGDDLFSCQPVIAEITARGADFLIVCKPESHKALYGFVAGAQLPTHQITARQGKKTLIYRYRWMNQVPLRDGKDAMNANWFSIEISNAEGKVTYRNAFVTSLPVSAENVAELARCGRARWKIENGSFNVLKNHGYNLEHNFGHGQKYLAMLFVTLNLLAFNFHVLCELLDELWRDAFKVQGARVRFFQSLRSLVSYLLFPSWQLLLQTLIDSKPPPEVLQANSGKGQ